MKQYEWQTYFVKDATAAKLRVTNACGYDVTGLPRERGSRLVRQSGQTRSNLSFGASMKASGKMASAVQALATVALFGPMASASNP